MGDSEEQYMERRHHILVIERDLQLRETVAIFLERNGYEVEFAYDSEQALAKLQKNHFDLAITDIELPQLEQLVPSTQVGFLAVTGSDSHSNRKLASSLSIDAYLVKPFDPMELLRLIRSSIPRTQNRGKRKMKGTEIMFQEIGRGRDHILENDPHRQENQLILTERGDLELEPVNVGELVDKAVNSIVSTLAVDACGIFELQQNGGTIVLRAGVGWGPGSIGRTIALMGRESQEGYTLLQREPVVVENYLSEKRFHAACLLREHAVTSGVTVLIRNYSALIGILGVYDTTQRKFNESEVQFLQTVANYLSQILGENTFLDF